MELVELNWEGELCKYSPEARMLGVLVRWQQNSLLLLVFLDSHHVFTDIGALLAKDQDIQTQLVPCKLLSLQARPSESRWENRDTNNLVYRIFFLPLARVLNLLSVLMISREKILEGLNPSKNVGKDLIDIGIYLNGLRLGSHVVSTGLRRYDWCNWLNVSDSQAS